MGGHRIQAPHRRIHAASAAALTAALALTIVACGGESSSDANESSGTFRVKVTEADFPTSQRLGQTSLMKLGIRNTGKKTVPALVVNVSVGGKEGQTSTLPFAIHDPQPELAQPDRPVWVLAAHYPKFAGSSAPGGAETSNQKTYDFGRLKPGRTASLVWKLSAVKSGHFDLLYEVGAGLGNQVKTKTGNGVKPGGSFSVQISSARLNKEVNGRGEVVEQKPAQGAK
ncbi:MAG TPA: hypothetical protein VGN84_12100 [Solirubrobacterales bacterium]|nr:hypothetical protein [Solirubrobacterales bacterium]